MTNHERYVSDGDTVRLVPACWGAFALGRAGRVGVPEEDGQDGAQRDPERWITWSRANQGTGRWGQGAGYWAGRLQGSEIFFLKNHSVMMAGMGPAAAAAVQRVRILTVNGGG